MSRGLWVELCAIAGVGGVTMRRLQAAFPHLEEILKADPKQVAQIPGIGPKRAQAIKALKVGGGEQLIHRLESEGIHPVTWDEPTYPPALRALRHAPPLLFIKGDYDVGDRAAVAIVGTRRPAPSSLRTAQNISQELTCRGITIVSGLAEGVDTAAHRGAVDAGGRTLAVLGCGLSTLRRRTNFSLADEIASQGALLSEQHPDAGASRTSLVARDRIISGLSLLVIVVESGLSGGSLRTAEFARQQQRSLAAVPGSPGTDWLISEGAAKLDCHGADWDHLAQSILEKPLPAPYAFPEQPLNPRLFDNPADYGNSNIASPKL